MQPARPHAVPLIFLVCVALAEDDGPYMHTELHEAPVHTALHEALAEAELGICEDTLPDCAELTNASNGLVGCAREKGVLLKCPKTCEACPFRKFIELSTRCAFEDTNPECYTWAAAGQCELNSGYMIRYCSAACGDYGARQAWMASRMLA